MAKNLSVNFLKYVSVVTLFAGISLNQAYAKEPAEIYTTGCAACHASGAAGAPKFGDQAAWTQRLNDRKIEGLYNSALHGRAAMPAKGLCQQCSEEEIKSVVDYMINAAKIKG